MGGDSFLATQCEAPCVNPAKSVSPVVVSGSPYSAHGEGEEARTGRFRRRVLAQ